MLNTLPLCWQSRSFVVPLRFHENTPDAGLEEEGQVWSLLSMNVYWKEITVATSPATHWLFAGPCALQSIAQINLLPPPDARAGELE